MSERPSVYVHSIHNPDEVRSFYEIPDALLAQVRRGDDRRSFTECLADAIATWEGLHGTRLKDAIAHELRVMCWDRDPANEVDLPPTVGEVAERIMALVEAPER